jgi:hypothetical protein
VSGESRLLGTGAKTWEGESKMNTTFKLPTLLLVVITVMALSTIVWYVGYYAGRNDARAFTLGCEPGLISSPCVKDAQTAEYNRVLKAVARTMRCSTEEEFAKGEDHECDPSEIEQDAGLVDADGNKLNQ